MKNIDKRICRTFLVIAACCLCGSVAAKDATVRVRMDDIMELRADFASTGSWTEYRTVSIPLDHTVPPGSLSLAFVLEGEGDAEIARIDSFRVVSGK